jgi:hypothetical protein
MKILNIENLSNTFKRYTAIEKKNVASLKVQDVKQMIASPDKKLRRRMTLEM